MVIVLANKVAYHKITIPVSAYISDEAMFPNKWFDFVLQSKFFVLFPVKDVSSPRKLYYIFVYSKLLLNHVHIKKQITTMMKCLVPFYEQIRSVSGMSNVHWTYTKNHIAFHSASISHKIRDFSFVWSRKFYINHE